MEERGWGWFQAFRPVLGFRAGLGFWGWFRELGACHGSVLVLGTSAASLLPTVYVVACAYYYNLFFKD
eukprot:1176963-Prorocentrum_minimum.AAC.4